MRKKNFYGKNVFVTGASSGIGQACVSRIYEESWKYAYRGIVPQEFLDDLPESRWVEKIGTPGWYKMVCVENGEYIGTSSFGRSRFEEYPDSGEVITIYLLPEYMG